MTLLHSLRTEWRSEWQMPQKRMSVRTSCSVTSRRAIMVRASGDVALAAEYAFALYMVLSLVLVVADFFHPVDRLPIEPLLNGEVRHGGRWRSAVPMFLAGRERDHVAGPNLLDRAAQALRASAARGHDKRLAQRVRVPGGPSARLERDTRTDDACWIGGFEQRVDAYRAGEILRRTFAGRLRATSFDVHVASFNSRESQSRVQRPVICSNFSGYRAPCTLISDVARSISWRSSDVS